MAGPGDEIAAGAGGPGRLRASHADREQAIGVLKAAFVQGRLDRDEFDLRAGQALASRTCAELAALTADIPAGLTGARPPEPARESVSKKAVAAVAGATAGFAGMLFVSFVTPDGSPFAIPVALVALVLAVVASTGWLLLFHDWLDKRAGRAAARGLPPGTGGEAPRRPASSGPGSQLPQAGHDLGPMAEAVRSRRPWPGSRPGWRGHWRWSGSVVLAGPLRAAEQAAQHVVQAVT